MPRQAGIVVENNFTGGLITQASGLNFPENACVETYNCEFSLDGSVQRRAGIDFETNYTTKTINRDGCAVNSYVWRNVGGNGDVTLIVLQVGATIYFYKTTSSSLSLGAVSTTVTLTGVAGAPSVITSEATFSDGNGYLFVTHPFCEPMRVSYNTSTDTATATNITIKIRDFEGDTADPYAVSERPTATLAALNVNHKYNLYNQGWLQPVTATATATANLAAWDTSQTTMPSNADIMWTFKNSSDVFSMSTIDNVIRGNTPAPKGHYILTLSNQDRDTASGLSGTTATTTSYYRPSTSAFWAGRVFYSGIAYNKFNSSIYFTQVVEREEQYGFCYQKNDPTAEDEFDLLPDDGGVIRIQEAGTIYKIGTVPGGLVAWAANGVWFITGSSGLGFTANDYTVQKISTIPTLNASSFVDVLGTWIWWNAEGIYVLASEGGNLPGIQSLTDTKIKSFYDAIPLNSKRYAKGIYDRLAKKVQWVYRSDDTTQITSAYEYDRILNLNTLTGAFFPWTVAEGTPKINGLVLGDVNSGATTLDNVIDGSSNNVIDGSGNQIVAFTTASVSAVPSIKYITSYSSGGSYAFTFADEASSNYLDWFRYDAVGVDYSSYFITGYKTRGNAIKDQQTNWVNIFTRMSDNELQYYFQAIWDFAATGNTGRWSSRQHVIEDDTDYVTRSKRLKVRGHGKTLQFYISSVTGEPLDILGWSSMDSVNAIP